MLLAVHNTKQFLDNYSHDLSPDVRNKLQEGYNSLKDRYDTAARESEARMKQLNQAFDELEHNEPDTTAFEEWLRGAERTMDRFRHEITIDTDSLRRQVRQVKDFNEDVFGHKGDLRVLNISAEKFIRTADSYRRALQDFRNEVMSRQFNRTFREAPETHQIRDKLQDLNTRYNNLQASSSDYYNTLSDLLDKLIHYSDSVENFTGYLGNAYDTLNRLLKEPVGLEPEYVQQQIDRLKTFHDDVLRHGRDKDRVRDTGRELVEDHSELKPDVDRTVGKCRMQSLT